MKLNYGKILNAVSTKEVIKILQEIVRIPSIAGSERKLADFLADRLDKLGFEVQVINTTKNSPNVLAWLRGSGTGSSLMLNGHIDTPPCSSGWTLKPYEGLLRDGVVYGHGVLDQKTGIAAQIMAGYALKKSGLKLAGDLCIACVSLHSRPPGVSTNGTKTIVDRGIRTDYAVVTEPTDFEVGIGNRGIHFIKLIAEGKMAHTTTPEMGVNAVVKMAKVILGLDNVKFKPDKVRALTKSLFGGPICYLNIGPIKGGYENAPPYIPDYCEMTLDVRNMPGKSNKSVLVDIKEVIAQVANSDPQAKVAVYPEDIDPGLKAAWITPKRHPIVHHLIDAVVEATRAQPKVSFSPGWTDAGYLVSKGGIPSVVYGPGHEPYYCPDEGIPVSDLMKATRVYSCLAARICSEEQ